uniref:WW domain-containing protein n=1 Tax=Panagrellus redivivus TaxID=6233 RepID=A0A7E4ZV32_PANRE
MLKAHFFPNACAIQKRQTATLMTALMPTAASYGLLHGLWHGAVVQGLSFRKDMFLITLSKWSKMYAQLKRAAATPPIPEVSPVAVAKVEKLIKADELETKPLDALRSEKVETEVASSLHVTDNDIRDYALSIGINPDAEPELMKIAEQGFTQPLDPAWRAVPTDIGDCYFVNRFTGQASWEHPMDEHYRELVRKHRSKNSNPNPSTETPLSPASDDHAVLSDAFSSDNELSSDSVTFGSPEAYKSVSPSGDKKVTFRDDLVEIREFDPFHGLQSPYRSDLFNRAANPRNSRPATPGFVPTEPCYRLVQMQRRSELVIQRNWRELCKALTESYSKSLQIGSAADVSHYLTSDANFEQLTSGGTTLN